MSEEAAPPRHIELEVADAAEVTTMEQAWLQGQIQANGQIDEFDQALLDFLAEEEGLGF